MTTTDSIFQGALSNMLTEVFDGPPVQEAYLLNQCDPGLLRQLDTIDASAASKRPMPGKTTIAAHVEHVHCPTAYFDMPACYRLLRGVRPAAASRTFRMPIRARSSKRVSPATIQVKFARTSIAVISKTSWSMFVLRCNSPLVTA